MRDFFVLPPAISADAHARLMYGISQLPENQKLVLFLFFQENLSLGEISAVLDTPEDEVAELFYWGHANVGLCPMPEEAEEAEEAALVA